MSLSQSFAGGKIGAGAVEKEAPVVERINHPLGMVMNGLIPPLVKSGMVHIFLFCPHYPRVNNGKQT